MILQIVRRLVQASVLLVTVSVALLCLYAHYRAARVIDDDQLMAGLRGEVVTKMVHPYVDRLADPQAFLDGNKGTLWSMRLMGVDIADPLAAAEMAAASKRIHWPLIASAAIPIVITLLFGRVFCSWLCPGYVLFELTGKLRRLLRLAEIRPGEVVFSHRNKYIGLFVGLALAALFSAPLFALIYPPVVISRALHAWVFGTSLVGIFVVLGVIVAFELFVSPRWWCRTMCPGGAVYGLIGWIRPVRIRLNADRCTGCRDCIPVCEEGINPITQSMSIECDNCGVCIRHCPDEALYYTISLPKPRGYRPTPRKIAALVVVFSMFVSVENAGAHHILGLPHYSYKENYPQRPTLEYPAHTGPYDVLLTSYPGSPVPGEAANLAFYIKNRETGSVYSQPITVRILQTSTFGDNTVVQPAMTREPFDNEYKFHVTFPLEAEYVIELSMPVEGRVEVIPFLMIAGQPTATGSVVAAGAGGFVLLFVVARAVQKKKARRRANAVNPNAVLVTT